MANDLWNAILNPTSPRYPTWRRILGGAHGEVPIKYPNPGTANLGPEKDVAVYKLDLSKFDEQQRTRLVDWICGQFKAERADVEAELDKVGFPIRAVDVVVSYSMRAFL